KRREAVSGERKVTLPSPPDTRVPAWREMALRSTLKWIPRLDARVGRGVTGRKKSPRPSRPEPGKSTTVLLERRVSRTVRASRSGIQVLVNPPQCNPRGG